MFLRTYIDYERLKNNGNPTEKCDEPFTRIYFAEKAIESITPPVRRRKNERV